MLYMIIAAANVWLVLGAYIKDFEQGGVFVVLCLL